MHLKNATVLSEVNDGKFFRECSKNAKFYKSFEKTHLGIGSLSLIH